PKPEELRWKLQGVTDDSYLYVRIEGEAVLPKPGSEISSEAAAKINTGVAENWPVMKIKIGGAPPREYRFGASVLIGDRATFNSQGKADSHHHFLVYSFNIDKGETTLFTGSADENPHRLIKITDRFIDIRLPLKALGVDAASHGKIEI